MTWQKVIAARGSEEAQFEIAADESTPEELGMEETHGQAADLHVDGLYLTLEAKSGNQYDFGVVEDATVDIYTMAEDIIDALAEGKDVWAEIDFDGNNGRGRVEFWADGAPWEGGDVKDNYGLLQGV